MGKIEGKTSFAVNRDKGQNRLTKCAIDLTGKQKGKTLKIWGTVQPREGKTDEKGGYLESKPRHTARTELRGLPTTESSTLFYVLFFMGQDNIIYVLKNPHPRPSPAIVGKHDFI